MLILCRTATRVIVWDGINTVHPHQIQMKEGTLE